MKTYIENNLEAVLEYLEGLTDSELFAIHNEFCDSINDMDREIYVNDEEFFNMFFENNVMEAIRATSYGEYNFTDEYVMFNGLGNLESFNYVEDYVDLDEIAENILEEPQNYYDIELEETDDEEE